MITLLLAVSLANPAIQDAQGAAGSLRIKTDITDVQVVIDDKDVGRTPLTLRGIASGPHRVLLSKEGYEDHLQQLVVSSRRADSLFVVMKATSSRMRDLPVSFKVLHQHRLGHCLGVLTVSADTLSYKADVEERDSFAIPITALKSVSRSWGPIPGLGNGLNAPTDGMAFRIEAPARAYGFMAYKNTVDDDASVWSPLTKELFDAVYGLWTASLKGREE